MKTTHMLIGTLATMMLAACSAPAPPSLDDGRDPPSNASGPSGSGGKKDSGTTEGPEGPNNPEPKEDGGTEPDDVDGTSNVEGLVNGKALKAAATTAYTEPSELTVKITDYAGACGIEKQDGHKKNGTYLKLNVKGIAAGVTTIKAGTYKIEAPSATNPVAAISAKSFDDTCVETAVKASAGEVTFDTVSEGMVKGTFKATIGGKEVTGEFESPSCAVPDGVPVGPCLD